MFHSTTILAIRHNGRAVLAGDGQVTFGQTGRQAGRPQDPPALRRPDSGRLRRLRGRFVRPVLALRVEARAVPRQPRARRSRAGEGLAHRSRPSTARGDAHRHRPEARRSCCRAPAISSSPTTGSSPSDRVGRYALAAARALARHTELDARRIAETRHGDRGRDLHLHEQQHHDRGALGPRPSPICRFTCPSRRRLPAETMTPREIVAELDKYIIGQRAAKRAVAIALRNRWRRQKLAPELARGSRAEEHPDDRPDRRRQDGDRAAAGPAGAVALPQGRGVEVHRGGLRRPRRRVDGPRPGRDRHRHGPRGARSPRCSQKAERNAEERLLDLLLPPSRPTAAERPHRASWRRPSRATADAREAARAAARRAARRAAWSRSRCARSSFPSFEIIAGSSVEEMDINLKDMLPGLFQGRTQAPACEGPRGARAPARQEEEQKLIDMDQVATRGHRARRAGRHHLHRRDRQDRRPRRRRTART